MKHSQFSTQRKHLSLAIACALSVIAFSGNTYAGDTKNVAHHLEDQDQDQDQKQTQKQEEALERVLIQANRPTTLPTEIPTTIEGITAKEISKTINAIDAEDALKYLPSLLVRKRYVGDYNHAVLATRASGTGNSARSLVYADGVLLSNLLGNGASFTPRWGLVTPEEIERVDVLYGPFSAAYSGNSVGAVVDYVTRMPKQFEAHAKITSFTENFQLYGTDQTYSGKQLSASLGNKHGDFSWWLNLNRLDSDGHPIAFTNKLASTGITCTAGVPVTGAINDKNPQGLDRVIFGGTGQYNTIQDHAKLKIAYEITHNIRASYTFALWRNDMQSSAQTYLKDAAGNPIYSGDINVGGKKYTLSATDISNNNNQLEHYTHGFNVKSFTKGAWDGEIAGSIYDYHQDINRAPSIALPIASNSGAGRITDAKGTGWNTFSAKAIWRPSVEHTGEFGYQREAFTLRTLVSETANWISGDANKRVSGFQGNTQLQSVFAQDTWRINQEWKTILGGRLEQWDADNGAISNATNTLHFGKRSDHYFSPKAAISNRASDDLTFKASIGKAVRMPTVSELYQGTVSSNVIVNNDPNLKPEQSWTGELSAEQSLSNGKGLLRATFFHEKTKDALFSQVNTLVTPNITNIQNVDQMRTNGLEIAYQENDVFINGLNISASMTYAHSIITSNIKYPASVGQWQPRVPKWRANFVASYSPNEKWSSTFGVRYSGTQFGSLDNSDTYANTYYGFSSFLVADIRVRYQIDRQWSAAFGVDNIANKKYWAFHPYTQRSVIAELKFDY